MSRAITTASEQEAVKDRQGWSGAELLSLGNGQASASGLPLTTQAGR